MQQAKAGSDFLLVRGTRSPGLREAAVGVKPAGASPFLSVQGEGGAETTPCCPPAPRLWARAVFVPRNDRVRVKMRTGVMKTATNWNSPLFF